jgi:hypothetical protein
MLRMHADESLYLIPPSAEIRNIRPATRDPRELLIFSSY